jgi:hypothetical protein
MASRMSTSTPCGKGLGRIFSLDGIEDVDVDSVLVLLTPSQQAVAS